MLKHVLDTFSNPLRHLRINTASVLATLKTTTQTSPSVSLKNNDKTTAILTIPRKTAHHFDNNRYVRIFHGIHTTMDWRQQQPRLPNKNNNKRQQRRTLQDYHLAVASQNRRYEPWTSGLALLRKKCKTMFYEANVAEKFTLAHYPGFQTMDRAVSTAMAPHLYQKTIRKVASSWVKLIIDGVKINGGKLWEYLNVKAYDDDMDMMVSFDVTWSEFVANHFVDYAEILTKDITMNNFTFNDTNMIVLDIPCAADDHKRLHDILTFIGKFNIWSHHAASEKEWSLEKQQRNADILKQKGMNWWEPTKEDLAVQRARDLAARGVYSVAMNTQFQVTPLDKEAHTWYHAMGSGLKAHLVSFNHTTVIVRGMVAPNVINKGTKRLACIKIKRELGITVKPEQVQYQLGNVHDNCASEWTAGGLVAICLRGVYGPMEIDKIFEKKKQKYAVWLSGARNIPNHGELINNFPDRGVFSQDNIALDDTPTKNYYAQRRKPMMNEAEMRKCDGTIQKQKKGIEAKRFDGVILKTWANSGKVRVKGKDIFFQRKDNDMFHLLVEDLRITCIIQLGEWSGKQ
eukprot:793988_1